MTEKTPMLKDVLETDGEGYRSFPQSVANSTDNTDINPSTNNKTIQYQTGIEPSNIPEVKVYTKRFYILCLFSVVSFAQSLVWNTWGPISQSAKRVFGWTDADIALLASWGPISFVVSLVPFSWLMDVKGLRCSVIVCSALVALGSTLRCITFHQPWATWLIHAAQFINGLGGPVAMSACTIVSATWFPSNERTTSTSVGSLFNAVGVAGAFIIGPLLVSPASPACLGNNSSSAVDGKWRNISHHELCLNGSNLTDSIQQEKDGIIKLQYIECGFCVFLLLAVLVYFPSKPPSPPSTTASLKRRDFKAGFFALLRHRQFWIISSVYGICSGVMNSWMGILDVDLDRLGIAQSTAGWMGFYAIITGTVCGLAVARGADMFAKHMKLILLILYILATGFYVWLSLVSVGIIPPKHIYVWVTVISGNALVMTSVPIIYELCCEVTFPISEGITTSLLALYNNVVGLVFLSIMFVPNIGVRWTNWCVLSTVAVCIPLLLLIKENYNRLDVDIEVKPPDVNDTPPEVKGSTDKEIYNNISKYKDG